MLSPEVAGSTEFGMDTVASKARLFLSQQKIITTGTCTCNTLSFSLSLSYKYKKTVKCTIKGLPFNMEPDLVVFTDFP